MLPQHDYTNSLRADGSRTKVRVDDVRGVFHNLKTIVYPVLMAIFFIVPFIKVNGSRWLLLDIEHRRFYLFGLSFNAQDIYLIFFLVTGLAFSLFFITAVVGRVWCGWSCPQTVFLDGLFRKVERLIEGPRASQIRLSKQPLGAEKFFKFVIKHAVFLLLAFVITLSFMSFFVPHESFVDMYEHGTGAHPVLFLWTCIFTGIIYLNFAWFREQLCLIVCPYGRLQSVLTDDDSIVIGYDKIRGEPRGKKTDPNRGSCIDCERCVVVCPTGIDIRNGLQLECIGCANCIDACNEVMEKIGQPKGLVRYDSLNGLERKAKKILRPRVFAYIVLLVIGMLVSGFTIHARTSFEANLLRMPGEPYLFQNEKILNQFEIHLFNKSMKQATYIVNPNPIDDVGFVLPMREITLESMQDRHVPLFVEIESEEYKGQFKIHVDILNQTTGASKSVESEFLGPKR